MSVEALTRNVLEHGLRFTTIVGLFGVSCTAPTYQTTSEPHITHINRNWFSSDSSRDRISVYLTSKDCFIEDDFTETIRTGAANRYTTEKYYFKVDDNCILKSRDK